MQVHHLLQIQGTEIVEWTDLTPQQAYWKQAQVLLHGPISLPDSKSRALKLECIPENLQVPMKKLQAELRCTNGPSLKEQLDSVIPFLPEEERFQAAFDMTNAWTRGMSDEEIWHQLPEAIKGMYS